MSGWFAMLDVDGAPADPAEAARLVESLRTRAPSGGSVIVDGPAALGQAGLAGSGSGPAACEPVRHGQWLAAGQVFLEDRARVARLLGVGPREAIECNDLHLLVRALELHGDDVVARFGGEYSFCAWNAANRKLVLGRDGFGVRQLFWTRVGAMFLASNTLSLLRDHPAVGTALNDDAILDFLCLEANVEEAETPFRDVHRVPAGHIMHVERGEIRQRRVWQLEVPEVDRRLTITEHAAAFRDALTHATTERLATRTSIMLSGGVDSPCMAACLASEAERSSLLCLTCEDVEPGDPEPALARAVAGTLRLAWAFVPLVLEEGKPVGAMAPSRDAEPCHSPIATTCDVYERMAAHGPVALRGDGGDELWRYLPLAELAPLLGPARFLSGALSTFSRGLRPAFGTGILALLRRSPGGRAPTQPPPWIAEGMRERSLAQCTTWDRRYRTFPPGGERAVAVARMQSPLWPPFFGHVDADAIRAPLEVRFPYFDRRVVDVAIRVPSLPGAVSKHVARKAFSDVLPRRVMTRPKATVEQSLLAAVRRQRPWSKLDGAVGGVWRGPLFGSFVEVRGLVESLDKAATDRDLSRDLRALSLARWIAGLKRAPA